MGWVNPKNQTNNTSHPNGTTIFAVANLSMALASALDQWPGSTKQKKRVLQGLAF